MLYVDPLGKITELNDLLSSQITQPTSGTPIKHNYTNKIKNLKKNNVLNNARLEDIERKNISNKINFIIYSVFACIFIIIFLVFLKKLNR
jgi:uncharacterized membrane protein YvbJ